MGIDPSEGPEWASHLEGVAPLSHATPDSIVLQDGRSLQPDIVIFATGYLYAFPFYSQNDFPFHSFPLTKIPPLPENYVASDLETHVSYPPGGLRVHNLDKHFQTFFHPDPTLAFVALSRMVVPCKLNAQGRRLYAC